METYVEYPVAGLNLTDYLRRPAGGSGGPPPAAPEPHLYDLYAVSSHFGGLNNGHYTAQVKNGGGGGGGWCNFDDARVGRVPEAAVKTRAAYILFYVRQAGGQPTLHNWWGG